MKITNASVDGADLSAGWSDGSNASWPLLWLRDHATDPVSYDARSFQRELNTAALDPDITPTSIQVLDDGRCISCTWPDVPEPVVYEASFLYRFREPCRETLPAPEPWDVAPAVAAVSHAFDTLDNAAFLQSLTSAGFAVIKGCPASADSVVAVADRLGYVRHSVFGGVWAFAANEDMADSAYTPKGLRAHTDGTYSHDAPGLQMLLCVKEADDGGESTLVDGFAAAARLRETDPDLFDALTRVEVTGEYRGDGALLRATRPMLRTDASGELLQVSYNNYDRAPQRLPAAETDVLYRGIRVLEGLFNDPARTWSYRLRAGEMLVFDNWRMLHGRSAYSGDRRMTGAYINREDFESACRVHLQA